MSYHGGQHPTLELTHTAAAVRNHGLAAALSDITHDNGHLRRLLLIGKTGDIHDAFHHRVQVGSFHVIDQIHILELDCLTLNEDRHTNNLAVLRNEETKEFRLCPIFDNGLSLLSDLNDYPLTDDLYTCIERVQAKPFDSDHVEQVTAAEQLYGRQLTFRISHGELRSELNLLSEAYSPDILQRAERVLLEQKRKHSWLF